MSDYSVKDHIAYKMGYKAGQESQAIRIAELEKDFHGAKEARDELQAVFDRCWEADQRAIKEWQEAHPGTDLVWPDRTKMVVWLLEKGNAASARIAELEAALERIVENEDQFRMTCAAVIARAALEGGKP